MFICQMFCENPLEAEDMEGGNKLSLGTKGSELIPTRSTEKMRPLIGLQSKAGWGKAVLYQAAEAYRGRRCACWC
jgi:hypothetical protein